MLDEEVGVVEEFTSFLRDGVVLCNLVNRILPGIIPKINQVPIPSKETSSIKTKAYLITITTCIHAYAQRYSFKAMENILFFLDACKKVGASPKGDLFIPLDLFELKNINKVIDGLIAFAEAATKRLPRELAFDLEAMGKNKKDSV